MHSQAAQAENAQYILKAIKKETKQNKRQDNEQHNDAITLSRENFS